MKKVLRSNTCICTHVGTCTHDTFDRTHTIEPPKKKPKKERTGKVERMLGKTMDTFMKYQSESDERIEKTELEKWKRQVELEEKMRKEEREYKEKQRKTL